MGRSVLPLTVRKLMTAMAILKSLRWSRELPGMETKCAFSVPPCVEPPDAKRTYDILWHCKSVLSPDKPGVGPERKHLCGQ